MTPLKNKPDFSNWNYDKLKNSYNVLQDLIFAYNHYDTKKADLLRDCLVDLREFEVEALVNRLEEKNPIKDSISVQKKTTNFRKVKPFKKR